MKLRSAAAVVALSAAAACATAKAPQSLAIRSEWLAIPKAAEPAIAIAAQSPTNVHITAAADGVKLLNGDTAITPAFRAIDSFDVSLERKEVVFSAKRDEIFDVGLVSANGGDIHWIPDEASDKVGGQWAATKVSYIIRKPNGDFVRTVHVPTGASVLTAFAGGRIRGLAWNPSADHYNVAWESADASVRVESMKYDGAVRRIVTPSSARIDAAVETIANAVLMRPASLRYNEKLPLVVWRVADRNRWSDARASLHAQV